MQRSESIKELATALAKAQATIEGAIKSANNPHLKSNYADLSDVWDAVREPLTANGLSIAQFPRAAEGGGVEVETMLMHTSGEFMSDVLKLPVSKPDAQGFGSAITYARRYALSALASVAPVDDDSNASIGKDKAAASRKIPSNGESKREADTAMSADQYGMDPKIRTAAKALWREIKQATTLASLEMIVGQSAEIRAEIAAENGQASDALDAFIEKRMQEFKPKQQAAE